MTRAAVDDVIGSARPIGRIDDVASLQEHLQCAIELEHTTLPPYLCALYSLDRERNAAAAEVAAQRVRRGDAAPRPGRQPAERGRRPTAARHAGAAAGLPAVAAPRRPVVPGLAAAVRAGGAAAVRADRAAGGGGRAGRGRSLRDDRPVLRRHPPRPRRPLRRARRGGAVLRRPGAAGRRARSRTAAAAGSSRWTASPARSPRSTRSSSRARARPTSRCGTATATCSTPSATRSPTTTASRSSLRRAALPARRHAGVGSDGRAGRRRLGRRPSRCGATSGSPTSRRGRRSGRLQEAFNAGYCALLAQLEEAFDGRPGAARPRPSARCTG